MEDGLSPCASSCNLPVLNKVFSLPSFSFLVDCFFGVWVFLFVLFFWFWEVFLVGFFFPSTCLLEAFRLRSSEKYRLASLVQFQAVSQLPAPSVENMRE